MDLRKYPPLLAQWQLIPIVALSLLSLLSIFLVEAQVYDEGFVIAAADRILSGELPYRDYWSIYPPGQFFLLAAAFSLFDPSLLTARGYDILIKIALLITTFLLAKRLTRSNMAAWIAWLLSLLWISHYPLPLYPVYPAAWLLLLSAYLFSQYLSAQRAPWLFTSILSLLLATLFRHDMGLPALFAVLVTLGLFLKTRGAGYTPLWHAISFSAAGLLLLLLALWTFASPAVLWQQLVATPAWLIPAFRSLPYPFHFGAVTPLFVLLPFILLATIAAIAYLFWKKSDNRYALLYLLLLCLACAYQVLVRSDVVHLLAVTLCGIPLVAVLLHQLVQPLAMIKRLSIGVVTLSAAGFLFWPQIQNYQTTLDTLINTQLPQATSGRAGYAYLNPQLKMIIQLIKNNTAEDEKIYVGVQNHDQFLLNDPLIYFLSERGYGTRYHELHPGITTTAEVQQQIIQELQQHRVRMVILAQRSSQEPNASRRDNGVNLLDNYLHSRYRMVRELGEYQIWWPK